MRMDEQTKFRLKWAIMAMALIPLLIVSINWLNTDWNRYHVLDYNHKDDPIQFNILPSLYATFLVLMSVLLCASFVWNARYPSKSEITKQVQEGIVGGIIWGIIYSIIYSIIYGIAWGIAGGIIVCIVLGTIVGIVLAIVLGIVYGSVWGIVCGTVGGIIWGIMNTHWNVEIGIGALMIGLLCAYILDLKENSKKTQKGGMNDD
jgi:hypothetical protein